MVSAGAEGHLAVMQRGPQDLRRLGQIYFPEKVVSRTEIGGINLSPLPHIFRPEEFSGKL